MNFMIRKHTNMASAIDNKRLPVGIECNDYFTKDSWSHVTQDVFPECDRSCQLIFFRNDMEKYALAPSLEIICTTWIDQLFIDSASKLKWIFLMQSGIDYLERLKINETLKISTARGISSEGIAEYVLCVSLMLLKNLHYALADKQKKIWDQKKYLQGNTHLLKEHKIGILGLGNNGRAVAKVFKSLGCYVMGYDILDDPLDYVNHIFKIDQLPQLLEQSTILVICLPLTTKTKNLIALKELHLIGTKGILINVGRGDIVNEHDLIYALQNRIISAAALDVFSQEPLPPGNKLRNCSNAIITPHIAGNIHNYVYRIQTAFIEELKNFPIPKS